MNRLSVALALAVLAGPLARAQEAAPVTLLTNAGQVLALGNQPARHSNVTARVRGHVTYALHNRPWVYFQDGTNGLIAVYRGEVQSFAPGTLIEVEGSVAAGQIAPLVHAARLTVLGPGALPAAVAADPARLIAGEHYARLVSVRGRVRDMMISWGNFSLRLHDGTNSFTAQMRAPKDFHLPTHWLDAEIEVRGMCWTAVDSRGKPYGFTAYAAHTNQIKFLSPGAVDVFERTPRPLPELSGLNTPPGARVRTAGVVTYFSGEGHLYFEDGDAPWRVQFLTPLYQSDADGEVLNHPHFPRLSPGERVEVVGAPQKINGVLTLSDAVYRSVGTGVAPAAQTVKIGELMAGQHAGRLVRLRGRVVNRETVPHNTLAIERLILQAGDHIFAARIEKPDARKTDAREVPVEKNDYVEVTGVNIPQPGLGREVHSFTVHLRDWADVRAVPPPAFWERPELVRALGLAGVVAVVAGAWILFQRRQFLRLRASEAEVAARERAEDTLRHALAAERELSQLKSSFVSMVSHEFRTPLEVILSSSNILDRYLDRLPVEKRKTQLRAIRKSVQRMNDLVEDVLLLGKFDAGRMACAPVAVSLGELCRRIVAEVETAAERDGAVQLRLEDLEGEASADESLCTHIFINLLGNALKYSPPGAHVEFTVTRRGPDAEFTVRDFGCGIPAADQARLFTAFVRGSNVGQTPGSGLGLVIVKRCVDLHDGSISCRSDEGKGTTFTVTLPLFDGTRRFRRRAADADLERLPKVISGNAGSGAGALPLTPALSLGERETECRSPSPLGRGPG